MRISWRKIKKGRILFVLAVMATILISCEEYEKGCMDASATNFMVSNQVPCCCEYPEIMFQTTYTDGMNTLSYTDTFMNQSGQRFLIRDFRFIASGIAIMDSLNRVYRPVDTFGDYNISPEILAVDVLGLNSTGANFTTDGIFNILGFSISRIEDLDSKMPDDFPLEHPFRDSSFYDFSGKTWIMAKVEIETVDGNQILLNYPISQLPVSVNIPGRWTKVRGEDFTVNFRINISSLFDDMDFLSPLDDLQKKFWVNFPASFEP